MHRPKRAKTHFEQIPLEIVKAIAEEESVNGEGNGKGQIGHAPKESLRRMPKGRIGK